MRFPEIDATIRALGLWLAFAAQAPNVIQTEGAHHAKASEVLLMYRRRQSGYESGLLKYGIDLYECVCLLTERLAQLPPDTEIRIQSVRARTVFLVAETGTEVVSMPEDAAFNGEATQ